LASMTDGQGGRMESRTCGVCADGAISVTE
jgi:hypothetical protein